MRRGSILMWKLELPLLMLLMMLLCLSFEKLEAKPTKHYGRCKFFEEDTPAFCRPESDCNTLTKFELNNDDFLQDVNCGQVDNRPLICCPTESHFLMNIFDPKPEIMLPNPPYCGQMLKDRIYNGNLTGPDEYPWMALIEITTAAGERNFVCGGVLIADRWVLTAAHCHKGGNGRISAVRLGEWNTTTERDCIRDRFNNEECLEPHMDVRVDLVKIHPGFNTITFNDDIALLRLAEAVPLTKNIKPICLPHTQRLRSDQYEDVSADICGWGRTETEQVSELKLKATLTIWQRERCRTGLQRLGKTLDERLLCASGAAGVTSCYGDSGGPLMLEEGSYYVVGVISLGINGCKRTDYPLVFTRVAAYMDWIQETLTQNQY